MIGKRFYKYLNVELNKSIDELIKLIKCEVLEVSSRQSSHISITIRILKNALELNNLEQIIFYGRLSEKLDAPNSSDMET